MKHQFAHSVADHSRNIVASGLEYLTKELDFCLTLSPTQEERTSIARLMMHAEGKELLDAESIKVTVIVVNKFLARITSAVLDRA